jgi:hypothetical protein
LLKMLLFAQAKLFFLMKKTHFNEIIQGSRRRGGGSLNLTQI